MEESNSVRQKIGRFCVEIVDIVAASRGLDYGPYAEDFEAICGVWNLIRRGNTRIDTPADHALYMVVVKLVRLGYRFKHDSALDAAAYLAILDDLEARA